jgi:hypothetical protein
MKSTKTQPDVARLKIYKKKYKRKRNTELRRKREFRLLRHLAL